MLSRYNGIGSLKLSIATAQNRRTSNIYMNDVPQKDAADSTYAEGTSECSSALNAITPTQPKSNGKLNNTINIQTAQKQNNDLKTTATTKFNLRRKPPKSRQPKSTTNNIEPNRTNQQNSFTSNGRKQKCIPRITSASTISNSSLQEYDDNELDTTELAKYMRQINKEIIHHDTK